MNTIAIIGSRAPTKAQTKAITSFINNCSPDTTIISGCAYGIDALALETAFNKSLHTIGYLPWNSYNTDVQQYCTETHTVKSAEAFKSVELYHPAPQALSQGGRKLHARNFDILCNADQVIACPSNKAGGGGTGQGIRIAEALHLPITIIHCGGES